MTQINTLIEFYNTNKNTSFTWLCGRSFSEAMVICLGAGPWRFDRRKKIQELALEFLNKRDLSELSGKEKIYPLDWQNNILNNIINYLHKNDVRFNDYFNELLKANTSHSLIKNEVLKMSGCTSMPKVLSLFCRDSLKIDSFPIDRHVKRKLIELGLPPKENEMIDLCLEAGLDPKEVAVSFVKSASNMDNPDWSI